MSDPYDFLRSNYSIDTPENVTFGYELAGIGSRFIAALVDSSIIGALLILLNLLLFAVLYAADEIGGLTTPDGWMAGDMGWAGSLVLALYVLFTFLIFWGYYLFFELTWNGQTPGKRVARIRVVRTDGNPATLLEIAIRNLVRVVDLMPWGYALGLVVMFCNAEARRLGDFAAGTLVVKERQAVTLDSLEQNQPAPPPNMAVDKDLANAAARGLTSGDYSLIRDVLERDRLQSLDQVILRRLAATIATKTGVPAPQDAESSQFLTEILAARPGNRS